MNYLQVLGFLCLLQLVIPFGMRSYVLYWKLKSGFPMGAKVKYPEDVLVCVSEAAFWRYFAFEFLLAVTMFVSGMMVCVAVLAVWNQIGPYFLGLNTSDVHMHDQMTTGVFIFLVGSFGFPWFLFHYVAIPSIRDTHQVCKEMKDCLLQVRERLLDARASSAFVAGDSSVKRSSGKHSGVGNHF